MPPAARRPWVAPRLPPLAASPRSLERLFLSSKFLTPSQLRPAHPGPLAAKLYGDPTPPRSSVDVRLILSGKFLDDAIVLQDLRASMGNPSRDDVVTVHLVIRPEAAKPLPKPRKVPKGGSGGGCCAVQ